MTPNILVDLVNTTVFKESEWIGANKEYRDVLTHVSDAKRDRHVLDLQKACSQSPDKFSKIWRRPGEIWTGFAGNGMDRKAENARFWEPASKGTFGGPPGPYTRTLL